MKDAPEAYVLGKVRHYSSKGAQAKKSQLPSVSQVQCCQNDDPHLALDYATVVGSVDEYGTDPSHKSMMNELFDVAKETDQSDKLLMFPPHGENPIK